MKVKTILSIIALMLMFGAFGQINTVIDSLEFELKIAKEDTLKVKNLNLLSDQYFAFGKYDLAINNSESALLLAGKLKYKKGKAEAYNSLGKVYDDQGNYPKALESYFSSLKIREEIGDKKGIAHSYHSIGNHYHLVGNFKEALEYLSYSLNFWLEIGDKNGIAHSYNKIGVTYGQQGYYSEALKNFFASLKIREEIGEKRGIAGSYNNIGIVYYRQGNYPKALEYYLFSLNIYEESGDKNAIVDCYQDIGNVYSRLGNYPEARKYLNDGLALNLKIGKNLSIVSSYESLSKLDSVEGNFAQALEHFKMSTIYKDSLLNEKSNKQTSQLKIQYETEKKDREIELLNKDNEIKKLQLEQQKEKQRIVQYGMIAGTVLLLLVGLLIFRSFRLRKKLEKQQAIIQERKRISADLHDDVGSGLSRIMLLSELVKKAAKTPETRKEAKKISTITQELSSNISEIIWALNSNNDYVENLVAYIRRYAAEYFENRTEKLKITTPAKIDHIHISGEHRRNIFFAVKEALHNIIKHAFATETELRFTVDQDVLCVVIKDNGKGMPTGELNRFGNGLKNMQNRMKSINGNFSIENHLGTKITLSLPV